MANHANFQMLRDEQYENCRLKIQQWPSLPMETISEVVSCMGDLLFTPDQLSQLQLDVSQKMGQMSQSANPSRRRPQQNYQNINFYLTNSLWLLVLGDNPLQNALVPVARHLGKLGLRLPSEKTCSKVTALLLYRFADMMDQVKLHQMFELVKAAIKKEIAVFPDAVQPFIVDLPHDPMQLHQSFFNDAFKEEQPVQCQVDLARLNHIHSNIRERMPPWAGLPLLDFGRGFGQAENANRAGRSRSFEEPALPNLQINLEALQRRGSFAPSNLISQGNLGGGNQVGPLALKNEPANPTEQALLPAPAVQQMEPQAAMLPQNALATPALQSQAAVSPPQGIPTQPVAVQTPAATPQAAAVPTQDCQQTQAAEPANHEAPLTADQIREKKVGAKDRLVVIFFTI